ncbi:MAG: hypothetical protein WCW13_03015 [archaeon]
MKNNFKGKDFMGQGKQKGFLITVDAFLSVTLILLIIILSFFYLSKVTLDSWDKVDLISLVFDEASVLEKSLAIENSILQSSSENILDYLNNTPSGVCFEVTVFSSTLVPEVHALKNGCVGRADDVVSYERTVAVRNLSSVTFYIFRVEGWLK